MTKLSDFPLGTEVVVINYPGGALIGRKGVVVRHLTNYNYLEVQLTPDLTGIPHLFLCRELTPLTHATLSDLI